MEYHIGDLTRRHIIVRSDHVEQAVCAKHAPIRRPCLGDSIGAKDKKVILLEGNGW
jgi:hypothetical protein